MLRQQQLSATLCYLTMSFTLLSLLCLLTGGGGPRLQESLREPPKLQKTVHRFEDKISFHYYHKDNQGNDTELFTDDLDALSSSKLSRRKPTKFIIHSWTDDKDVPWITEMRDVMASTGRWNVIVVDWAPLSHAVFSDAYDHTNLVGEKLAAFTGFLVGSGKASFRSLHYIGHGLGALAAGQAARRIQRDTGKSISRITALDPTISPFSGPSKALQVLNQRGPLTIFSRLLKSSEGRVQLLNKTDAKFVDVIHTDGEGYGTMRLLGEVDYFPNGGKTQPGCSSSMCCHVRACEFWSASVRKALAFKAYNYDLWGDYVKGRSRELMHFPMGIAANPTIPSGIYFVETTDDPPFVYTKHKFIRK